MLMVTFLRGFSAEASNGECELHRTGFSRGRKSGERNMFEEIESVVALPAAMRLPNLLPIATREACRGSIHGVAISLPDSLNTLKDKDSAGDRN